MTGLNGQRVYLDWNATAPLRPEARRAMLEAMDVVGNPSSVHAEGRAAKALIERARGQVAALVGCEPSEVVFTSGATEAVKLVTNTHWDYMACSEIEHDCVAFEINRVLNDEVFGRFGVSKSGTFPDFFYNKYLDTECPDELHASWSALLALTSANGETGVRQPTNAAFGFFRGELNQASCLSDTTQSIGKPDFKFKETAADYGCVSAHKLGGPAGVGCLIVSGRAMNQTSSAGGGQEQGRRSGTENVIGIAGLGAAAEAAQRDLENGVWEPVEKLRNILESTLAEAAPETIFFGQESPRLPNTSCFAVPGWKGETQVMQMDLAGFAVSAGSACSSGKVNKASRVLLAMGFDEITASSAIRVSMGPTTTEAEVLAFADAWKDAYRRRKARAA